MKHTFVLIDKIMILITDIPPRIRNDSELAKARRDLNKLKEYTKKLEKLIDAHKTTQHLTKLLAYHIDSIPNWAQKVDAQFKKLDNLMQVLNSDIQILETILKKFPKVGFSRIYEKITQTEKERSANRKDRNQKDRIYKEPANEWASKIGDMSMGIIMAGFHHAEHDMEEFRQAAIFEHKHLLEILGELSAVDELLE